VSVVWIIDAEQWPRALLRAELIERGFDAVGHVTADDAIKSLPWRPPDAIVVDLRSQHLPDVERLLEIGVPVLVIGGRPEIHDLPKREWAAVMRRPVSIGEIADRVEALVGV
jgi:DNA-binding response OmpR family regulator